MYLNEGYYLKKMYITEEKKKGYTDWKSIIIKITFVRNIRCSHYRLNKLAIKYIYYIIYMRKCTNNTQTHLYYFLLQVY